MMKKVLITGSKGNIGRVLKEGIKNHELHGADMSEHDVCDMDEVLNITRGMDAIYILQGILKRIGKVEAYIQIMH